MKRVFWMAAALCAFASTASAQYTGSAYDSTAPEKKAELIVLGGYAFTIGQDVVLNYSDPGEIDVNDNPFWGLALDFNVARRPDKRGQLRLMYRREDSEVTFTPGLPGGPRFSRDCAFEYWHVGGVGGIVRGKAMPFTAVTLGATRLVVGDSDEWKFSMIFGLGVKVYTSPKVGIMIQGNWPITFTDVWGGVTVGTGGAGVGLGGTGISQLDIGGGLIIAF